MVVARWRCLSERLVRPVVVVVGAEAIERALLFDERRGWRRRGVLLQRPVHPLVATVLLRLPGLDALGNDAEP